MTLRATTRCTLLLALTMLSGCGVGADMPYNAGYTIVDFERTPDEGDPYVVTVAVWYPTAEREGLYRYGAKPMLGRCAEDAAIATEGAPYPLVIYSHGYGGSGIAAPYLTEHLARQGYIVAAPDHADAHQANRIRPPADPHFNLREYLAAAVALANSGADFDFAAHDYRMAEARLVIDRMLALSADPDSWLHGMIDTERIGMCGHSFGSFTTLACVGAGDRWRDDRISAAISISGGVFMWSAQDYQSVAVPIMIMWGALEGGEQGITQDRVAAERLAWENLPAPKVMFVLKEAAHFTFAQGGLDRILGHEAEADLLLQQYRAIQTYCTAMFDRYLRGDLAAEETLTTRDPMFTEHRYVPQ